MQIHTSLGKREVPDCMANDSQNMSDIELIETLLEQNKKFLDPVLVSICIDKGLLKKGEAVEDLEMKLTYMKVQEYAKLKAENEKLQRRLNLTTKYKNDVKGDRTRYFENVKELQQQLKEKDEEIALEKSKRESLQQTRNYWHDMYMLKYEDIAKQVCEKIKQEIGNHNGLIYGFVANGAVYEILNKIERGEK